MKYVEVGKIVTTHGIKGEVKVKSTTSFTTKRFEQGATIFIGSNTAKKKATVTSHRVHKGMDLVSFLGVDSMNEALLLVGNTLYASVDEMEQLEENEFYYFELIDMLVYLENGEYIGVVIDIKEVPQGEILVIKREGHPNLLIPFRNEFVKDVFVKEKNIIITPIEGML